jgi:hypothetical protein
MPTTGNEDPKNYPATTPGEAITPHELSRLEEHLFALPQVGECALQHSRRRRVTVYEAAKPFDSALWGHRGPTHRVGSLVGVVLDEGFGGGFFCWSRPLVALEDGHW